MGGVRHVWASHEFQRTRYRERGTLSGFTLSSH